VVGVGERIVDHVVQTIRARAAARRRSVETSGDATVASERFARRV
jgi:hypothetical protein